MSKDVVLDSSGGFASAVRRGNVILLSGHVASDPVTHQVVGGDNAYNQAIAAFAGVERTLKAMGYGHKDVTRLTIFVVDFPKNWKKVAKAYSDVYKGISPPPANTMVGTTGLVNPNYLVEIQVDVIVEGQAKM